MSVYGFGGVSSASTSSRSKYSKLSVVSRTPSSPLPPDPEVDSKAQRAAFERQRLVVSVFCVVLIVSFALAVWWALRVFIPPPTPRLFSVRVAKSLGSRGYDQIRLSVIRHADNGLRDAAPPSGPLQLASQSLTSLARLAPWDGGAQQAQQVDWTYVSQFRERWMHMHLSSAVVPVVPGEAQTFDVYGRNIRVKVPRQGEGVVGLIVSDVCFMEFCDYPVFDTKNTLLSVMHGLAEHDELDYWMNVGDLFYDSNGTANQEFFSELSLEVQAKIHTMTIGNHDYWYNGKPEFGYTDPRDDFGFGFMQWYAQDAMSAKENASQPFRFDMYSYFPDVAHFSNFFWYNMVGNVALISFSGHTEWYYQAQYFEEACVWAQAQNPDLLVLLGHWSEGGNGAAMGMTTPEAYTQMMLIPACAAIGSARVKFIEGHNHCNRIALAGTGFMFGSFGKDGCGDFGIPILDTRGGQATLWYFALGAGGVRLPQWQDVIDCLTTRPLFSCLQYAQVWMQQPLIAA